ncbi:MAG: Rap1a/Tai family immunity protein [Longimicrobiales bacterium]
MRWWISLLLMLPTLAAPNAQVRLDKSDEFLRLCDHAAGEWADLCTGYVAGLNDMLRTAKLSYRADVTICMPAGVTLGQAIDGLLQYLRNNSKERPSDTAAAYVLSLVHAYPCTPNPNLQAMPPTDKKL